MPFHYEEFDLSGVRTYPLKSRPSKARVEDFAKPVGASPGVGELLDSLPNVLAAAGRLGVPVTVHVAIGTDIIHMHPSASGAALGEGSLRDFRYFVSNVARLAGGVFLNCGSAVVLPEVFLKAVVIARNQGVALDQ